jgi:adenine-specific DNA-methyltransferase
MAQYKPVQTLNKAYRQLAVETNSFNHFVECLKQLLTNVSDGQREETQKEHLQVFLSDTFYKPYYMAPEGDIDLAIHLENTEKSNIGLLVEVKSTSNKNEMITNNDLNRKALQELLLYYLRERVTKKNTDLKYLIATNIYEYFIFDAQTFEKSFYNNAKLRKEFNDFESNRKTSSRTDFFFNEIASKYIAEVAANIDYTYFDLRNYQKHIDEKSDQKLIELYKTFSNTHLLKLPFLNDSNSLNKNFYAELLHIIGLEEQKDNSKIVIVRQKDENRHDASILEGTINILDSEDRLDSVRNLSFYGETHEEQLFNIAMELCITWINRILFLKLLEAQLLKYHNNDANYKFLTIKKIKDFDDLNRLFFQVLARDYDSRTESIKKEFHYVPYLNSSLFEISDLERSTICINNLSQSLALPLFAKSVLRNRKNVITPEELPTLQYLFEFLDAYNFSSEGEEGIQDEAKTLINASVLGLIFEKINGHKDGSVFTPGFITMYMSHESIERTVVNKFNEHYGWTCSSLIDLYNNIDDAEEANKIINGIKICDVAVGSGHYLVSSLNELIHIKYELGILTDGEGKRIKKQFYSFTIENDELIVTDEDNNLFHYVPGNQESQRIQELLFNEKRYIIENCLFGVDINPNSVRICRLRLWIELLKNAYYTKESGYTRLETLPNIDINIKCGNSLLHRFDINDNIQSVLAKTGITISEYKEKVSKYRNAHNKEEKKELSRVIEKIKSTLRTEISYKDKDFVKLQKRRKELSDLEAPSLFEFTKKEQKEHDKQVDKLHKEIKTIEDYFEDVRSNRIYLEAFEWRIEFPEVLDDEGNFIGFDCIIGNPPYMRIQEIRKSNPKFADYLAKHFSSATGSFDIYATFVEQSLDLINNSNGFINFIMPLKWTNSDFGIGLRKLVSQYTSKIIDFDSFQVFDASTYTALQWFDKKSTALQYCQIDDSNKSKEEMALWLNQIQPDQFSYITHDKLSDAKWYLTDNGVQAILEKISLQPRRLSDVFEKIYQGLATSKDDVYFLYDCEETEGVICGYSKQLSKRIQIERGLVKPLLKGEDVHRYMPIVSNRFVVFPYKLVNNQAILYTEEELLKMFPLGYQYLKENEQTLRDREKGRLKTDNFWYKYIYPKNLNLFDSQKLISPEISLGGNFTIDKNGQYYSTTTIYGYIKKKEVSESYLCLMALLNSQLLWWFLVNTGTTLANGYFRYKPSYLKSFPIPNISDDICHQLEGLSLSLLCTKDCEKRNEIEKRIDKIVFDLYNLSVSEIIEINSV